MNEFNRQNQDSPFVGSFGASTQVMDQGLRAHMMRVYNYMAGALGVSGLLAYLVAATPTLSQAIFGTPLQWVVMLAPLGFVLALSFGIRKMSFQTAQMVFWGYAAAMGLSLASIFLMYTEASIARAFLTAGATFAAMSLWGYTTKRDLTKMGSFLMMGVIGLVIASVVNIFLKSTQLDFIVSVIGVAVFTLLTAYDTQKIKQMYNESWAEESKGKLAIMGALSLYLDFINLFMFLLRFMGDRR
jgi:FtsH-binding integral membrane protein